MFYFLVANVISYDGLLPPMLFHVMEKRLAMKSVLFRNGDCPSHCRTSLFATSVSHAYMYFTTDYLPFLAFKNFSTLILVEQPLESGNSVVWNLVNVVVIWRSIAEAGPNIDAVFAFESSFAPALDSFVVSLMLVFSTPLNLTTRRGLPSRQCV
jgi:hypothetical protein